MTGGSHCRRMLRVRTPVDSYVPIPRIALSPAALSVLKAQYISLRDDATSCLAYSLNWGNP